MCDKLDPAWVVEEFTSANLGDERLHMRLASTVAQLAAKPEASIGEACYDEASKDGAYRLFANERVERLELLDAHRNRLRERVSGVARLFAIQDTTFFDFNHHRATKNLGSIGRRAAKEPILGLIMHHTLIVDNNKRVYGISSQEISARQPKELTSRAEQKASVKIIPIEQKESVKWINACQQTEECLRGLSADIIYLGDRENDIYEFLKFADDNAIKYVVRNSHDRKIKIEKENSTSILEALANAPIAGERKLEIKGKDRKVRKSRMRIKYAEVTILPPSRDSKAKSGLIKDYKPVAVTAISAEEIDPPPLTTAVSWTLLTNIHVSNLEDAMQRIAWYKLRWTIEDYHKVLKSSCKVEDCRLSTREKLEKFITIKSVIAFKIMELTFLSRSEPDLPCTVVLTSQEWQALFMRIHRTNKFPVEVPSLKEAANWIARLGGYKDRPQDPPPGYIVISRGWEKLQEITNMMVIFNDLRDQQRCED